MSKAKIYTFSNASASARICNTISKPH